MRPIRLIVSAPVVTPWIPVDYLLPNMNIGLFVSASGAVTGTGSIEVTPDDIYDSTITPVAFAADAAALTAFTSAGAKGAQTTPIRAVRGNFGVSATGSWILRAIQQGDA